ncbi:MAG: hemolysin [Pseudonocardiales bacterium]|nr:hemolysin [Pseudonocardiales bacterium]
MDSDVVARSRPSGPRLYDARRCVEYDKPKLRGWLHLLSFECALVLGTIIIVTAHGAAETADAAVYGGAVAGLFGVSALYHRGQWTQRTSARLQRIDHLMIVLLIAGSATPPMAVCLPGVWRLSGLIALWSLAAAAVALRLARMNAPERLVGSVYVGLGVAASTAIPAVWVHSGVAPALLLLAGGVLYVVGAVGYHRRSPDPRPSVFGYHEVFHSYVTLAAACHYIAIACFLL